MPRKIPMAKKLENIPLGPRLKRLQPNPETMLDDLLAMAANRWTGRKGSRRPREQVEKILTTKRLKKALAHIEQVEAENRERRRRRKRAVPFGERSIDHVLAVMVPGEWHSRADVAAAAGVDAATLAERQGLVERAEVDENTRTAGGGWLHNWKWVYRLTELGVATREAVMMVRVLLVAALLTGCAATRELQWSRADGRSTAVGTELRVQGEMDMAYCNGERAKVIAGGVALNAGGRQDAGQMVFEGCMAGKGYVLR